MRWGAHSRSHARAHASAARVSDRGSVFQQLSRHAAAVTSARSRLLQLLEDAADGERGGLLGERGQVRAHKARRARGHRREVHLARQPQRPRQHLRSRRAC